jgi:hypothetical protein
MERNATHVRDSLIPWSAACIGSKMPRRRRSGLRHHGSIRQFTRGLVLSSDEHAKRSTASSASRVRGLTDRPTAQTKTSFAGRAWVPAQAARVSLVYKRGCTPLIRGVVAPFFLGDVNSLRLLSGGWPSFLSVWHSQQFPAVMEEKPASALSQKSITACEVD